MAERARAAARVRVGRRSGGQRGPRRRQLGAGGGGGLIGSPAVFLRTDARRLRAITRAGATASHYVGRLACCAALSYHFTSDSVLCDPRRTSGARPQRREAESRTAKTECVRLTQSQSLFPAPARASGFSCFPSRHLPQQVAPWSRPGPRRLRSTSSPPRGGCAHQSLSSRRLHSLAFFRSDPADLHSRPEGYEAFHTPRGCVVGVGRRVTD